jgi:uncharacterized protein (DUF1697 family)
MARFIALLRGVNVGGANRVAMADLRALLASLGYRDVVTLLNSGNAIFSAPGGSSVRHAKSIAGAIAKKLKIEVPVIVKSAGELEAIVAGNRLRSKITDPSRLLVAFVQETREVQSLAPVQALAVPPEEFTLGAKAAYLLVPSGIMKSKAAGALLGRLGRAATTRNWATVLKLRALASQRSETRT